MYYDDNTIVFLDGKWVPASATSASIYGQTLHYGLGVFEGIRSYKTEDGTRIFKAEEHYERLHYSAQKMQIKIPYLVDELIKLSYDLLEKNNLGDAYLRPLVFLGENMSLQTETKTHVLLCAWEWGKVPWGGTIRAHDIFISKTKPQILLCRSQGDRTLYQFYFGDK